MTPNVSYHCPCLSSDPVPPPPNTPSSSYCFHPLYELFFCEECDAIRCNRCVSVEVSGYYCPNCLFEVPSASVRAEKNRCVSIFCYRTVPSVLTPLQMRTQLLHVPQLSKHAFRRTIRPSRHRRRKNPQSEYSRRAALFPLLQLLQMGFRRGRYNVRKAHRPCR